MSTKLTKVAAYQQTLCAVRQPDYLLRKLAGDGEPTVQKRRPKRALPF